MQPPGKEQGMTRISSSQKEKRDLEIRTKNENECLHEAQRFQRAKTRFRKIREGDVVRMHHTVYEADGLRDTVVMTGIVIYKDAKIITVQGDHYAESFQLFDLATKLKEHIPC